MRERFEISFDKDCSATTYAMTENPDNLDPEDPEDAITLGMLAVTRTRDEFFRWIDFKGYRRPKFWDGENVIVAAKTPSKAQKATPRKRGTKRSDVSIAAEERLRSAVQKDPALLLKLPNMSDKDMAEICKIDYEKDRHHLRYVKDVVLGDPEAL
jgi:hypothetical protein